jgi:hypothetical protein
MNILADAIKAARPNLSLSSVKTYVSILGSLHRKVWGAEELDLNNFNDTKAVLAFLKDVPAPKRKTVLSACVVLTGLDEYRKQMLTDVGTYNDIVKSQVMSDKQKASEISPDEVKAVYDALAARATALYKKTTPTVSDLLDIQSFVLMALMGGVFIAPRRSLDWTAFKLRNFNTETDNYMTSKFLIFNQFKTVKSSGKQEVECPPELKKILTKWSKVNPTDHLLFNSKMQPLSSPQVTQTFNRIFNGRKVSTNQLRHTYLTGRFSAYSKEQKVVADTMKNMGSSESVLNSYVRF